jgi:hypothetical protein
MSCLLLLLLLLLGWVLVSCLWCYASATSSCCFCMVSFKYCHRMTAVLAWLVLSSPYVELAIELLQHHMLLLTTQLTVWCMCMSQAHARSSAFRGVSGFVVVACATSCAAMQ